MKKTLFVVMVHSSFYAWSFIGGRMVPFNSGDALDVDDLRGVEAQAKSSGFNRIVFHQTPEGSFDIN